MASSSETVIRLLLSLFKQRPVLLGDDDNPRTIRLLEASLLPEAERAPVILSILSEVAEEMADIIADLEEAVDGEDARLKEALAAEKAKVKAAELAKDQAILRMTVQLAETHAELAKAREGVVSSAALAGAAWNMKEQTQDYYIAEKEKLLEEIKQLRARVAALENESEAD